MTQRGFTMLFKDTPPPSTWIPSSSVGLLPTPERMALLKANLTRVQAQIEQTCSSCHRSTEEVCLVAVSKHMPVHDIYALYQLGHRHFGENYVHELLEKAVQLPSDIQWHFIGHLQSNKVKALAQCSNLCLLETLDSLHLAQKLNKVLPRDMDVLLQVNTSMEPTKSGLLPDQVHQVFQDIQATCPRLHVRGLMTLGRPGHLEDLDTLVSCQVIPQQGHLSMGMSEDFIPAIQRGSTLIRMGRALFGDRT